MSSWYAVATTFPPCSSMKCCKRHASGAIKICAARTLSASPCTNPLPAWSGSDTTLNGNLNRRRILLRCPCRLSAGSFSIPICCRHALRTCVGRVS
eukprot:5514422-Amphidinium_carterae.1